MSADADHLQEVRVQSEDDPALDFEGLTDLFLRR
jgi:hypothetical protein